jgi:sortase A
VSRARRTQPKPHIALRLTGVIGELMITLGLLVGLFVVWQLWWTDVEAGREQAQALESLDWSEPAPTLVAVEEAPDEPPPAVAPPAPGATFASVLIPRFGSDYEVTIAEGVGKKDILDTGAIGHYPETALPGELGNFSLAGHRTTYGKPLNKIADLQQGDAVVVRTQDTWYVYEVTESLIVAPSQVEVIAPVPGLLAGEETPELTERYITLTSCHPMFSARERYIVHGTLTSWMPVSQGTPAALAPVVQGGE